MAKKNVSAIVSGAGLISSVWTELVIGVQKRGGKDEDLYRLATPYGAALLDRIVTMLVDAGKFVRGEKTVKVRTKDGSSTLLKEAGPFDLIDERVRAHGFGGVKLGACIYETVLVPLCFDSAIDRIKLDLKLEQLGLRPAHFADLLHLLVEVRAYQWDKPLYVQNSYHNKQHTEVTELICFLDEGVEGVGRRLIVRDDVKQFDSACYVLGARTVNSIPDSSWI
jgi:hypothetical protein